MQKVSASYIHEPYWTYDGNGLREYGERIVKRISPCFIDEAAYDFQNRLVTDQGEKIKVRRVREFGRVLPNLFLKDFLDSQSSQDKAVPRIFLIPKERIRFKFHLPYLKEDSESIVGGVENNPIQVESDSFVILQEYIDGDAVVNDKSFWPYGHCDFNAEQIVTSKKNGKKYLIDTKESKNFFSPELNPEEDYFRVYWPLGSGRALPQNPKKFVDWQHQQQQLMLQEKHYPVGRQSVPVDLGQVDCKNLENFAPWRKLDIFQDLQEEELYFSEPRENLSRYLSLGLFDLFRKVIDSHPTMSLDDLVVPFQVGTRKMALVNPVQFILRSQLSEEASLELLAYFKNDTHYFENPVYNHDKDLWPLYLALRACSPNLMRFLLDCDADPNIKVCGSSILDLALGFLREAIDENNRQGESQLVDIVDNLVKTVDVTLVKEGLQRLLSKHLTDTPSPEMRARLVRHLLPGLDSIDSEILQRAFDLGIKDIIDGLIAKDCDAGVALMAAVQRVRDPSHAYIRKAMGDDSPDDPYWYQMVVKILAKNPSEEALDRAICHAVVNSKVEILKILLEKMPDNAPRTYKALGEILRSTYGGDLLLEKAILSSNTALVKLMVSRNVKVTISHFRHALKCNAMQDMVSILADSQTLNLAHAMNDAIDLGCIFAIQKLLVKLGVVASSSYKRAFQTKSPDIIDAISANQENEGANRELMELCDVKALADRGDSHVLQNMVQRKINLAEALVASVHFITFAKDNHKTVDKSWFALIDEIMQQDVPARGVDHAVAIAFLNSKITLLLKLVPKMPSNAPKTKQVIVQIMGDKYTRDQRYQEVRSLGNANLLKVFDEVKTQKAQGL